MLKITSELKTNAGFKTSIAVLEISSYTSTETVQLVTGSTMPMAAPGKNISVNYQVYKSANDKASGANAFQPDAFPYSINIKPSAEDVVNDAYIYSKVSAELTSQGYTNEVL